MRLPLRHIKDGTHQTVTKFFWLPMKVWDTERQADVWCWLETAKVIRIRRGGYWADHILWHEGHDRIDEPTFSPEARRVFKELGIE